MGEPQIIRTPTGEELVVLPRADYEALRAAADEAEEDAADLAIARERWDEWNAAGRLVTPPEVALLVLEGCQILEAFRRYRGMDAAELARRAGVDASDIDRIERREIEAAPLAAAALARELNIDPVWLSGAQSKSDAHAVGS